MAVSITGTIGRIGRNGVSFGISGTNVVRASVNGIDVAPRRVCKGTGRFVGAIVGLGPTTTGNACVGDVFVSDAVDGNVGVSPGSIRWLWGFYGVGGRIGSAVVARLKRGVRRFPRFCLMSIAKLSTRGADGLHHGYFGDRVGVIIIGGALLRGTFRTSSVSFSRLCNDLGNAATMLFAGATGMPTGLLGRCRGRNIPSLGTTCTRRDFCMNTSGLTRLTSLGDGGRIVTRVITLLRSPTGGILSTLRSKNGAVRNILGALNRHPRWVRRFVCW